MVWDMAETITEPGTWLGRCAFYCVCGERFDVEMHQGHYASLVNISMLHKTWAWKCVFSLNERASDINSVLFAALNAGFEAEPKLYACNIKPEKGTLVWPRP